jgi:hypothetical protein
MLNPFHWLEGATVSLSATSTSGNVALPKMPTGRVQIRVHNKGPNTAFIAKGTDSTIAATLPNGAAPGAMPIPSGAVEVLTLNNTDKSPITHIAAICASTETATLYFTVGAGI